MAKNNDSTDASLATLTGNCAKGTTAGDIAATNIVFTAVATETRLGGSTDTPGGKAEGHYRGVSRLLHIPPGKKFYQCVEAVVCEIRGGVHHDRNATSTVVAAIARDGVVHLKALESRSVRVQTLASRSDAVAFFGGSLRTWSEPYTTVYSLDDRYLDYSRHIQKSLDDQTDDWFDGLGSEIPYNPEYLLLRHLSANETARAALLAHSLLGRLAQKPTRNSGQIFRIIKYLNRHRDKNQFQAAILHGLQMLSQHVNELADRQHERHGQISKSVWNFHRFLSLGPKDWAISGLTTFPAGFVHVPGPGFTAHLI